MNDYVFNKYLKPGQKVRIKSDKIMPKLDRIHIISKVDRFNNSYLTIWLKDNPFPWYKDEIEIVI